ncbi:MAG: hypothetical protein GXP28_06365 [Planctomycetes bacterium]|nr:hypothetical protein [Planctomycetota bacterium]
MNLLGKFFIVSIAVAAIFMMAISMAVYTNHHNWRAEAEKLTTQLSEATNKNEQLASSYRSLESQLSAEVEASQQEVRKLESERVALISQNTTIQTDLDQLRQQQRASTAAVASTQQNNEKLTAEVEVLRAEIRENQQARDEAVATTIRTTDESHQLLGKLSMLNERHVQLAQQLGEATSLLNENGIDANDPQAAVPRVRGLVSATTRQAGVQLIEITIGSDDGLKPQQTIEIFRGDRYLGRAEILRTEPDRAVGRIIRRFQQGQIQEGDDVATKLRVG